MKYKKKNYHFDETDDEGFYCDSCYENKLEEIEEREVLDVKEPECD